MAVVGSAVKQPVERLDYDFNYTKFLDISGELQEDSLPADLIPIITITPNDSDVGGLIHDESFVDAANNSVKIWLRGGINGTTYKVEITIETTFGRFKQDELFIVIVDF